MIIFKEIQEVICKQLKASPEDVALETSFIEDLTADSLDIIELIMAIEEKFNIEIPDEDAEEMETVDDVVKYIAGKINRNQDIF